MGKMKVLALDAASQTTGYAIVQPADVVLECGKLYSKDRDPYVRIAAIIADARDLVKEHKPDKIIIETTSGKTSYRHGGNGAGLSIYGMAVGAIWQAMVTTMGADRVVCVLENEWTTNRHDKANRVLYLSTTCAKYMEYLKHFKDTGMDVSDAIALGQWWLRRQIISPKT